MKNEGGFQSEKIAVRYPVLAGIETDHPHPILPPSMAERGMYFTLTPALSLRERGFVEWHS